MLPFLCRPTPQQSAADTHVNPTISLTTLPFAELTIAQLPPAGVEGNGAVRELFAREPAAGLGLSPPISFDGAAAKLENTNSAPTTHRPDPATGPSLVKRRFAVGVIRIARGNHHWIRFSVGRRLYGSICNLARRLIVYDLA